MMVIITNWKGIIVMKKKLSLIILFMLLSISLPGCAKTNDKSTGINDADTNNTTDTGNNNGENDGSSTGLPANTEDNSNKNDEDNKDTITDKPEKETPSVEETPSSVTEDTPEIKQEEFSARKQYSDQHRAVKFLGLKEYNSLKGDNYTDKARKNKKFLVLFLSVTNTSNEKDYINPNYITAKVNGKEIEHTFLVNDPENYQTLFANIDPGNSKEGFVVWEVPKKWRKLEIEYNAWKNVDGLVLKAEFTPGDLSDPEPYSDDSLS